MMEALTRFLTGNLLASLAAGLWAVLVVYGVGALAGVRSAETRNELLVLPFVKSTLVLLGVGTVLPLPVGSWSGLEAGALPFGTVAPWLLVWTGAGILAFEWLRRRAGRRAVEGGQEVAADGRPTRALERLRQAFRARRTAIRCPACVLPAELPRPRLYLSDRAGSPALVFDEPPRLVLPRQLESELDDAELEGVIAHELAHLWLRHPCGGLCESRRMRSLAISNPTSLLLGGLLARQEELACDEIAAGVTGQPEALASALVKTYRYRRDREPWVPAVAARLVGRRPLLRRRLERLLETETRPRRESGVRRFLAFAVTVALLFVRWG